MLKHLSIFNIILVENAHIEFQKGLNVITGETGAGKSAVLQALKLLCGERFESNILRHGTEKAWVEAAFDVTFTEELKEVLKNSGISYDTDEYLILRRELNASGKSRCLINNQLAQKNLLQIIAAHLLHIVGQHATRELTLPDSHRQILDKFGQLEANAKAFSTLWHHEKLLQKQLEELIASEKEKLRIIETLQREIEELSDANLKEGEEEDAFAEYSILINAENLTQNTDEILHILQNDPKSILNQLVKTRKCLEKLLSLDESLQDTAQLIQNAEIELQEAAYTFSHYLAKVENNPHRVQKLEKRLTQLSQLKKRYGNDVSAMLEYLNNAKDKLSKLENSDAAKEELQNTIHTVQKELIEKAAALSAQRKKTAATLSQALTKELRTLNMPHVEVEIQVEKCTRTQWGENSVEIYLKPNIGEKIIPLRQCASGGEMSRLVLALQYLLSGLGGNPTLFFDEIDANIGGETASLVGKKLRAIGDKQQVVCITHFTQVASYSHNHLKIQKTEKDGRTHTIVTTLEPHHIEAELQRMSGGAAAVLSR
ncbi:MAG: DNA repair protein RecN [Parachlamydiales bacterium]|jgi:DNA repair protein RecN (Recombination protein N)